MEEKKILFKLENDVKTVEINGVNQVELLSFICRALEMLIEKRIVSCEELLTSINMYLTLGIALSKEIVEDKEIKKLIDELADSMLELFRGIKSD